MDSVYFWWAAYAVVMAIFAYWLGATKVDVNPNTEEKQTSPLGIFVDSRHRVSLSRFQIILWTIIIFSLIFGVWTARAIGKIGEPLNFSIPSDLLLLAGISLGSTVLSSAIKSGKDQRGVNTVSAEMETDAKARNRTQNGPITKKEIYRPRFYQLFMVEEGSEKVIDKIVDTTKFQNFLITLLLAAAFVISGINEFYTIETVFVPEQLRQEAIAEAEEAGENVPTEKELKEIVPTKEDTLNGIKELPGLDDMNTFLILLGISHAGYLAGKIPDPQEED